MQEMLKTQPALRPEMVERIYRSMFRIRKMEERVADIYPSDQIKSPVHLSIGQESPSVGVCEALRATDVVFGTYRGHALYLAKGGDMKAMVAELFGKRTGCGKGKAGSMHLSAPAAGMMGTSAIVATTIPQAAGYALAEQMMRKDTVVAVFFGDGAMEEGVFHESINFASLFKLPILFVCENNFYAIHTPLGKRVPRPNYCERAASYDVPAQRIMKNDVIATYRCASAAIEEIRAGAGPRFIEVETYRWREHVGPAEDWHLGYRSEEEGRRWKDEDELLRLAAMLSPQRRRHIEAEALSEIDEAFRFAEGSPFPEDHELYSDVFQDSGPR